MNEAALIIGPAKPIASITFTQEAIRVRNLALDSSSLIGRVSTPDENQNAVEAQSKLKQVSMMFEKARVEITKPLLEAQRKIKHTVDLERRELEMELSRVSKLIGDFQTIELAKVRAAEAAKREELTRLERERQSALAGVKNHDEADAVNEHFDAATAEETPPTSEPVRATGQVIKTDWEITRINDFQLARARPDLVRRIEFDIPSVKKELARGVKLPGVEAREVVKAGVRVASAAKVLEV